MLSTDLPESKPDRIRRRAVACVFFAGLLVALAGAVFSSVVLHTRVRGTELPRIYATDGSLVSGGPVDYVARCGVPLVFTRSGTPYIGPRDLQFRVCAPKLETRRDQGLVVIGSGLVVALFAAGTLQVIGRRKR